MNKELEKQLIDLAVGCAFDPNGPANKDGVEELKSFIDKHFVAKENAREYVAIMKGCDDYDKKAVELGVLYTKEQVLELIGEDKGEVCECDFINSGCWYCGYNQAKAEIRERLTYSTPQK